MEELTEVWFYEFPQAIQGWWKESGDSLEGETNCPQQGQGRVR